jgi:hypothetical protein
MAFAGAVPNARNLRPLDYHDGVLEGFAPAVKERGRLQDNRPRLRAQRERPAQNQKEFRVPSRFHAD